jgi:hypothetical protein
MLVAEFICLALCDFLPPQEAPQVTNALDNALYNLANQLEFSSHTHAENDFLCLNQYIIALAVRLLFHLQTHGSLDSFSGFICSAQGSKTQPTTARFSSYVKQSTSCMVHSRKD